MTERSRSIFWSSQRPGHQRSRSPKVKFCRFQHFSSNLHNSGTRRARAPRKSAFDNSFNALSLACPHIWPKINGLGSREQKPKIVFFWRKRFFCNNFWVSKDTAFILLASYFSFWDVSNELYFDLKRSFGKFDLRSRSWPYRERSCCISVNPYGRHEHIYSVFIALAGLSKVIAEKNCWWTFMTWNDLGDMARGHWSQYSDSGCQVYL